jgi:hypothetical protein
VYTAAVFVLFVCEGTSAVWELAVWQQLLGMIEYNCLSLGFLHATITSNLLFA